MIKDIKLISLRENDDAREAMRRLDKGAMGIVLVVNENEQLIGIATDGDIRRAILAGKSLSAPLGAVMHTSPITCPEGTPATELLRIMLDRVVHHIPIVNADGKVVDIALLSELKTIPLSSPDITYKEVELINEVLSTPYLSIGAKIREFEAEMASYIGTKYAIAVNSGTSGLHLCIRSLNIKDGDEVITTPFSFIASANCILFERAKPVFVDIDKDTLCIDVNKIEEKITARTRAILPVHILGHPCQMDKILEIASQHNLAVIEDACEAIGAEYRGKKVGSFGDCAVFAFYPNKQITTGEGGMVVTDSEEIARLCRSLRNQGRDETDSWLSHTRLGYNYRMPELSASLGVVQMRRLEEILQKREKVANSYNQRLSQVEGLRIPYIAPDVRMSWFVYVVRLDEKKFCKQQRDEVIGKLQTRGVNCRDYFPPIHLEPFYVEMFGYREGSFPVTEQVAGLTIALPFYNNLIEGEVEYVCNTLTDIIHPYLNGG